MQQGLLVEDWPIVLGCDTSGVVAEVGKDVTNFKVGDAVFGPVRVGFVGYMAFQEYVRLAISLSFLTLTTINKCSSSWKLDMPSKNLTHFLPNRLRPLELHPLLLLWGW